MEDVTIIINDAPYGVERPWNALRLALTLMSGAVKSRVNVFLLGDAVSIAKKGQTTSRLLQLREHASRTRRERRNCASLWYLSEIEGIE